MAEKAKVPIVVAYLDYKKKEMGIKGVIYNTQDYKSVFKKINILYPKTAPLDFPSHSAIKKYFFNLPFHQLSHKSFAML